MTAKVDLYKALLLGLYQPGAVTRDPDSLHGHLVEVDAEGLAAADDVLDQLELELFPHTADQTLEQWEELFGVAPLPGQTDEERRAVLVARWRGAQPSTPAALRSMLVGFLNPTHALRDRHDDEDVSFRFEQVPGGGTITETGDLMTLAVAGSADGRWNDADLNQCMALVPLVDRDDDFLVEVLVDAYSVAADAACGIVLFESNGDAYVFGPWHDGTERLRAGLIEVGASSQPTWFAQATMPTAPFWIVAGRENGAFVFRYGASLAALGDLASHRSTVKPRKVGIVAFNDASAAVSIDVDTTQIRYGKVENNVELIETPLSIVPVTEPEAKFIAFVHRDPDDAGVYDIAGAQRQMDRAKQAHTLILVGESDCFRWDDDQSLFDRDTFGS